MKINNFSKKLIAVVLMLFLIFASYMVVQVDSISSEPRKFVDSIENNVKVRNTLHMELLKSLGETDIFNNRGEISYEEELYLNEAVREVFDSSKWSLEYLVVSFEKDENGMGLSKVGINIGRCFYYFPVIAESNAQSPNYKFTLGESGSSLCLSD